jgi:putative ABC transport system permease protein
MRRHNASKLALLSTYSWQEVRHHAWRSATAVLAVMLGVALALFGPPDQRFGADEFSSAARSAAGSRT